MNVKAARKFAIYTFLILITAAVFWQVNQYDFIDLDDSVYVTDNNRLQSGLSPDGIIWSFSTFYAEFWHPLTWFSLFLDYGIYGLNAGGYHVTNVILHILSTLLLFRLFHRMTDDLWKSAFVAAAFALHPLHVESVAWIAKRKDVLSGFFWVLTLCFYVYYTKKTVVTRYLLVLFSFILALMSKPMVVTLPAIMILFDFWPLNRMASRKGNPLLWQLKEKAPFFMLSAVFTVITFFAQHNPHAESFPLGFRIMRACTSFVTYLGKMFWPDCLAVYYPFSNQLPVWPVIFSTAFIIMISVGVIILFKRLPYLSVGWLWYAITIFPIIGILNAPAKPISDHYTYLPSIGITIMLAWGVPSLFPAGNIRKKILFPASITFILVMAVLSWQQCSYWKNGWTLFSHALQTTRDNAVAHSFLAVELDKEGKIEEALRHHNEAIRIIPDYFEAYTKRGNTYVKQGQYQSAIQSYNEAVRLNPYYAASYNGRGTAYAEIGQYSKAIENYNQAITLRNDYPDAFYNRGLTYVKLHQYQLAFEDFNTCIRMKPNYRDAYHNRGVIYLSNGYVDPGCRDARKACELGNCRLLEAAQGKQLCR